MCQYEVKSYPLAVKDYLDLLDAIEGELELTRKMYEISYTFGGEECSMKTKRSFETFTNGGPNANGNYKIKITKLNANQARIEQATHGRSTQSFEHLT